MRIAKRSPRRANHLPFSLAHWYAVTTSVPLTGSLVSTTTTIGASGRRGRATATGKPSPSTTSKPYCTLAMPVAKASESEKSIAHFVAPRCVSALVAVVSLATNEWLRKGP